MTDIQRYYPHRPLEQIPCGCDDAVAVVLYPDHLAAIEQVIADERAASEARNGAKGFPTAYDLGLIDGREQGQRDVYDNRFVFTHDQWADECDRLSELTLAAAVQRVEALPWDEDFTPKTVIAAIKGDNDGSV